MKKIFKYLTNTKNLFLIFGGGFELWGLGYIDSDSESDIDGKESTSKVM